MTIQKVCLFGASGTMGLTVLEELWRRRKDICIVLLLRPSRKNSRLVRPYARAAGLQGFDQGRVVENQQLKLVWGDATNYDDVLEAIRGVDWVLDAMAFISPQADYYPEQARAVNTGAIENIVRAIEAQPGGAEHIRLVYTGTVAATGDRLPPIHWGRAGDPLKPSIYDFYAVTKIAGERCVLESTIRHWVSLRMTYIIPTNYPAMVSLMDPIMFHQPLNTRMENISDRDAGFGMANCLDIPGDSSFWRRIYNMGGGPAMRCTAEEFMNDSMQLMGLSSIRACTQRRWFAQRNFHMQYFLDSEILNQYLHYWRDSMDDCWAALKQSLPIGMRMVRFFSQHFPAFQRVVEQQAAKRMRKMAEGHRNGTAYWVKHANQERITAFYGSETAVDNIQNWAGAPKPEVNSDMVVELYHGYDESKPILEQADLEEAAVFRGGACLSPWDGDMFVPMEWRCARGHSFALKPNTVLHGGHWCPDCAAPPWDYDAEAQMNPFFAQVWYPNHDPDEMNYYPEDLIQDIAGADRDEIRERKK